MDAKKTKKTINNTQNVQTKHQIKGLCCYLCLHNVILMLKFFRLLSPQEHLDKEKWPH